MEENKKEFDSLDINDEKIKDPLSYDAGEFEQGPIIIETEPEKNTFKEIYEWVSSIAWAVILALLINTFLISLVQVDGSSMVPTLHHGERLIVRKIAYTPQNSDVVIVKSEPLKKYIVKRVIATPSQKIGFDAELNVLVDGVAIDEPYIESKQVSRGGLYQYPVAVPKEGEIASVDVLLAEQAIMPESVSIEMIDGKIHVKGSSFVEDGEFIVGETKYLQNGYFVLGDNRNNSSDSRVFGIVPEDEIIGKAVFRFLPISEIGLIK